MNATMCLAHVKIFAQTHQVLMNALVVILVI